MNFPILFTHRVHGIWNLRFRTPVEVGLIFFEVSSHVNRHGIDGGGVYPSHVNRHVEEVQAPTFVATNNEQWDDHSRKQN
jgi:hypothetical protein